MSRNALVTGCARQPGAAIARRLISAGWEVIVTARRDQDSTEWEDAGYQTARLNQNDPEEPEDVIEQSKRDVGNLAADGARPLGVIEDITRDL